MLQLQVPSFSCGHLGKQTQDSVLTVQRGIAELNLDQTSSKDIQLPLLPLSVPWKNVFE